MQLYQVERAGTAFSTKKKQWFLDFNSFFQKYLQGDPNMYIKEVQCILCNVGMKVQSYERGENVCQVSCNSSKEISDVYQTLNTTDY